jgi:hypothetical protein
MNSTDASLLSRATDVECRPLNDALLYHLYFTLAKDRYSESCSQ